MTSPSSRAPAARDRLLGALLLSSIGLRRRLRSLSPPVECRLRRARGSWIPHWRQQMDFTYRERPWCSRAGGDLVKGSSERLLRRNHVRGVHEDDLGGRAARRIGIDNMLWAATFRTQSPRGRCRGPPRRMFAGTTDADLRQIPRERRAAVRLFVDLRATPCARVAVLVIKASELAPGTMRWAVVDRSGSRS